MTRYIIVKYATYHHPGGEATVEYSVHGSYTARQCGVDKQIYDSEDDAQSDLEKLSDFNPTVDYGIVRLIEYGEVAQR